MTLFACLPDACVYATFERFQVRKVCKVLQVLKEAAIKRFFPGKDKLSLQFCSAVNASLLRAAI